MKRIFTWQCVLLSLILTIITFAIVNGPTVGTGYLQALVPGVVIPDLTQNYSPSQLPGLFQAMGEKGQEAYITVNNLDFLFIASNILFGISAFGALLLFIMPRKALATKLAFIGALPGLFDAIESICFRLIVMDPYAHHAVASQIAATATKAKFAAYNMALLVIFGLIVIAFVLWAKKRPQTKQKS